MANSTFFPRRQRSLLSWSNNLRQKLTEPGSEARYGVTPERVAPFVAAQAAFAAAMVHHVKQHQLIFFSAAMLTFTDFSLMWMGQAW